MAEDIYKAIALLMGLLLGAGGLLDFMLWYGGQETISSWLRDNPWWWFVPALLMGLFLVGMTLHLVFQGDPK